MKILVSACLLGKNCKYNGGNNYNKAVQDFIKDHEVLAICPEILGSLTTPRRPVEIVNGVIYNNAGENVDIAYREATALALKEALHFKPDLAILQSRSPTCGVNQIYDGTFSKTLIPGRGIFAEALHKQGIQLLDLEDLPNV